MYVAGREGQPCVKHEMGDIPVKTPSALTEGKMGTGDGENNSCTLQRCSQQGSPNNQRVRRDRHERGSIKSRAQKATTLRVADLAVDVAGAEKKPRFKALRCYCVLPRHNFTIFTGANTDNSFCSHIFCLQITFTNFISIISIMVDDIASIVIIFYYYIYR